MKRPAFDFGTSGVYRLYCDGCSKPVLVCHQGHNGQYCSKDCLDTYDSAKVKISEIQKVKIVNTGKVKTVRAEKVKTPVISKVKIEPAPAAKVKISSREQNGIGRRKAIRRIRAEIMKTGREPTISEVQARLTPLGLNASVRTVWKDLNYCRAAKRPSS